jgi:hypothetical protein
MKFSGSTGSFDSSDGNFVPLALGIGASVAPEVTVAPAAAKEGVAPSSEAVGAALSVADGVPPELALEVLLKLGLPVAACVALLAAEALGDTEGVPPPMAGAVGVGQGRAVALLEGERVDAPPKIPPELGVGVPVPAACVGEPVVLPLASPPGDADAAAEALVVTLPAPPEDRVEVGELEPSAAARL